MNRTEFFQFLKQSIPSTIWAIGLSSLLINLATSVIQSGSAVYLKVVLGIAVSTIGVIEAVVECIANIVKIFSGIISDYLRRRKWLMVFGFILLTISKPLIAISKNVSSIIVARTIDRIGNGIQASPRDALISDAAPKETKGACYGLRQSLAVVGSTLGGVFGMTVMKLSGDNFQLLFVLATIPAILAVVILIFFVTENLNHKQKIDRRKIRIHDMKALGKRFWILMLVVAIFMAARFGEFFISLHACENLGMKKAYLFLITIIFNMFTTLSAFPTGKLSDRMSKINLLFIGIAVLFVSDICIGCANNLIWIWIGAALWGIQRGISEGIFAILISDYVPKELRGTGFGVYYITVSVSAFCANAIAGGVSQYFGEGMAYLTGALICVVATVTLLIFKNQLSQS